MPAAMLGRSRGRGATVSNEPTHLTASLLLPFLPCNLQHLPVDACCCQSLPRTAGAGGEPCSSIARAAAAAAAEHNQPKMFGSSFWSTYPVPRPSSSSTRQPNTFDSCLISPTIGSINSELDITKKTVTKHLPAAVAPHYHQLCTDVAYVAGLLC